MDKAADPQVAPRQRAVGRPRRTGSAPGGDPRQEILDAAARFFAEQGYAATTMSEIARAVGLGQSSVYYWFRSKEEVLRALAGANRESLDVARRLAAQGAAPAVHLYAVLHADVLQLCRSALDFHDLERVAHAQADAFAEILADYGRLGAEVEEVVRSGMRAGDFVDGDPRSAVVACLAQTEGVAHRYRGPAPDGGREAALPTPADAARLAARTAVRALLVDPARIDDVERDALAHT